VTLALTIKDAGYNTRLILMITSQGKNTGQAGWWVYIIETVGGRFYTGITIDVERRLQEHQAGGRRGARFFRSDAALKVVYLQSHPDRASASRREAAIKHMSRADKLKLVQDSR
jgi:putative endonuclease